MWHVRRPRHISWQANSVLAQSFSFQQIRTPHVLRDALVESAASWHASAQNIGALRVRTATIGVLQIQGLQLCKACPLRWYAPAQPVALQVYIHKPWRRSVLAPAASILTGTLDVESPSELSDTIMVQTACWTPPPFSSPIADSNSMHGGTHQSRGRMLLGNTRQAVTLSCLLPATSCKVWHIVCKC